MLHYYVHASGDGNLALSEVARIADTQSGALIAVDGIDTSDITVGKAQLPLKKSDEKRDYLFYIEAEDTPAAEYTASVILDTAVAERDKPVYNNLQQFLHDYALAPWRDHIHAILLYDGYDEGGVDLLIFALGQSENDAAKIYYRGSAAQCCCDLLKHFTGIPVKM